MSDNNSQRFAAKREQMTKGEMGMQTQYFALREKLLLHYLGKPFVSYRAAMRTATENATATFLEMYAESDALMAKLDMKVYDSALRAVLRKDKVEESPLLTAVANVETPDE